MSRRFGRQQKRRMLNQNHELERKVSDLKHQLFELRELSKRNRRIVEETASLLGEHFITFDPAEIELYDLRQLGEEWRVQSYHLGINRNCSAFAYSSASTFMEKAITEIQSLPVMKCNAMLDQYGEAMHFRFTFNGKTAGYAISRSEIMQRPGFKEAARKNVAEAVSRLFMDTEVSPYARPR